MPARQAMSQSCHSCRNGQAISSPKLQVSLASFGAVLGLTLMLYEGYDGLDRDARCAHSLRCSYLPMEPLIWPCRMRILPWASDAWAELCKLGTQSTAGRTEWNEVLQPARVASEDNSLTALT